MTSRAGIQVYSEHDNADRRLTEIGYEYDQFLMRYQPITQLVDGEDRETLRNKYAEFSKLNEFLCISRQS